MRILGGVALSILLLAPPATAQQHDRRGFIGIAFGPSAPLGNFADASPANGLAGRAKPGYNNSLLSVGWRFGNRLGAAATASYGEYFIGEVDSDDWWQVAGLTVGPMYTFPLGARAAVDLKGMLGLMGTLEVTDSFGSNARSGAGLMIDVRGAFRYDFSKRWCAFVEAGMISSAQTLGDGSRKDVRAIVSGIGVAFRPVW
jgi:hypothetical protein